MGFSELSLLKHWQDINNLELFWKTRETGLLSRWEAWLLRRHNVLKQKFYPLFAEFAARAQKPHRNATSGLSLVVSVLEWLWDWDVQFPLISAGQEHLNLWDHFARKMSILHFPVINT